jgi:hypothetical protein
MNLPQVSSLIIIGISIYALVENVKYLIQTYEDNGPGGQSSSSSSVNRLDLETGDGPFSRIHEELQSWVIHESSSTEAPSPYFLSSTETSLPLSQPLSLSETPTLKESLQGLILPLSQTQKYVLNLQSLSFDLNNSSMCLTSSAQSNSTSTKDLGDGIYFMIIVHSSPEHFEARQAIRSTWGSVKSLKNFAIRLIFVLGKSGDSVQDADLVENSIIRESELFGDIVTGTFIDSYRNLTYKHLLGYKWAMEFCPGSAFILKADDDAFIDMFQLFDFISRTYGFKPSQGTLVCNVFPEGTKPVRAVDTQGSKWAVTSDEYPHVIYPKYCGGLAYLATPDVIRRVLSVSDKVRFFWIDDVFVTGILRELIAIEPFYLNLRYTYETRKYRKWLDSSLNGADTNKSNSSRSATLVNSKYRKFPFMIAHVERGPKFSEEMNHLWRKTLRAWSDAQF